MVQPTDTAERTQQARDEHQRRRVAQREAHTQHLTEADALRPQPFEHTQFIAFCDPTSIKFDKFGTMSITFRLPPEFRDHGLDLRDAHGQLLSIDVQTWNEVPGVEDDDG